MIDLIEQSIIWAKLSPVKLLNASKGMLVVVYDSQLLGEKYERFQDAWDEIAGGVMYDEWTVLLIKDTDAGFGLDGGRIFRKFARDILDNNDIGITAFTPEMFLFLDDWAPEKIFGPDFREKAEARAKELREDPDFFDDDIAF
ncbi:hypothetical protein D3C86_1751020 [compost metagenome]